MSHKVVPFYKVLMAAMLIVSGQALAESRAEVLERIKPIGSVAVEGQATPAPASAPAAEAKPAPVAAAEKAPAAPAAPAAAPVQTAAAPAGGALSGADLYQAKTCFSCHGADAKSPIMPVYPRLAGQNAVYLANQMRDIKSGSRDHGQTMVMRGIMANVSDQEIQAIAEWLSTL